MLIHAANVYLGFSSGEGYSQKIPQQLYQHRHPA